MSDIVYVCRRCGQILTGEEAWMDPDPPDPFSGQQSLMHPSCFSQERKEMRRRLERAAPAMLSVLESVLCWESNLPSALARQVKAVVARAKGGA